MSSAGNFIFPVRLSPQNYFGGEISLKRKHFQTDTGTRKYTLISPNYGCIKIIYRTE